MRFIFFGTSEFAADILNGLMNIGYLPILVVTQPDKPAKRKKKLTAPAVKKIIQYKELSIKKNISIMQPEELNDNFLAELKSLKPKFGILAAYGKIIPQAILDVLEPLGIINVHPSLLPKYRGPSPIQSAIINGENETGITLIKLVKKIDAGPIIGQETIAISKNDTAGLLEKRCAKVAIDLIKKTLPNYISGKIRLMQQNEQLATFTKLIKKEEAKINWNEPAELIERKIRAYQPWPIAWTFIDHMRIQILKAHINNDDKMISNYHIGEFFIKDGKLCVKNKNKILIIEKLKPENKKEMSSEEFIRGFGKRLKAIKSAI